MAVVEMLTGKKESFFRYGIIAALPAGIGVQLGFLKDLVVAFLSGILEVVSFPIRRQT